MIINMLAIGIILIIVGVLACVFGIVQNTILYALFADTGAQLARFHSEIDFHIVWLFIGPGTTEMIVGAVAITAGIVLIVKSKKGNKLSDHREE